MIASIRVYRAAVTHGGPAEWNAVYNSYKASSDPHELDACITGLTGTKDTELLDKVFEMMLKADEVSQGFSNLQIDEESLFR
jgi:hypothetical protein